MSVKGPNNVRAAYLTVPEITEDQHSKDDSGLDSTPATINLIPLPIEQYQDDRYRVRCRTVTPGRGGVGWLSCCRVGCCTIERPHPWVVYSALLGSSKSQLFPPNYLFLPKVPFLPKPTASK